MSAIRPELLQAGLPEIHCEYLTATASTQTLVKANSLLVADHQTAGVGRRGNQWLTPPGQSVCLSYRFSLPIGTEQLSGYQITSALAILTALQQFDPTIQVQLKWPNDLYHQGAKFAGILINLIPGSAQLTEVVVGIGINWTLSDTQLASVDRPVCNAPLNPKPDRTTFIIALIKQIQSHNQQFIQLGLANFLTQWQSHDYLQGKTVQLQHGQETLRGHYHGISETGELMLETESGIKHLSSGEVSLRAL